MSSDPFSVMGEARAIEAAMGETIAELDRLGKNRTRAEAAYKQAEQKAIKKAKAQGATNPEAQADGFLESVDEWLAWNDVDNAYRIAKLTLDRLSSEHSMRQSELSYFKEEMSLTRSPYGRNST